MNQEIEAVFEKGVFRPLRHVDLPECQRVTVVVPEAKEIVSNNTPAPETSSMDDRTLDEQDVIEEFSYEPLSLRECKTIRVKFQVIGEIPLLPYPVDDCESECA